MHETRRALALLLAAILAAGCATPQTNDVPPTTSTPAPQPETHILYWNDTLRAVTGACSATCAFLPGGKASIEYTIPIPNGQTVTMIRANAQWPQVGTLGQELQLDSRYVVEDKEQGNTILYPVLFAAGLSPLATSRADIVMPFTGNETLIITIAYNPLHPPDPTPLWLYATQDQAFALEFEYTTRRSTRDDAFQYVPLG